MVKFVNIIPYHLNVGRLTGQICLGLLKADKWSSESRIRTLLHAISCALVNPQLDSYVDDDVNYAYHHNRKLYEENARKSVRK